MTLQLLRSDFCVGLGLATFIGLPTIAKWYSPISPPDSSHNNLDQIRDNGNTGLSTSNAIVTFEKTVSLLPSTLTTFLPRDTDTVTTTSFTTIYTTTTETVTTTSASWGGIQHVTEHSGFAYGAATPRPTSSLRLSNENIPQAIDSTLGINPSYDTTAPGPYWKNMMLTICAATIALLLYVIKKRTGQPWMLEVLKEKKRVEVQVRYITKELHQTRKAKEAAESKLEYEVEQNDALLRNQSHALERVKKICKSLTTVRIAILGFPEAAFENALDKAVEGIDKRQRERDNLILANKACAREILSLRAAIKKERAEAVKSKFQDGRGDLKLFQLTQDVKDHAFRRHRDACESEIKSLAEENDRVTRQRDNFMAERDFLQRRKDEDDAERKSRHSVELENMTTAERKLETAMQANDQLRNSENIEWEIKMAGLRSDVIRFQKELTEAQQTILQQPAPQVSFAGPDTIMSDDDVAPVVAMSDFDTTPQLSMEDVIYQLPKRPCFDDKL